MATPFSARLPTWDDIDCKGNYHENRQFYDTKLRITGNWVRVTKHSEIQSRYHDPETSPERRKRKNKAQRQAMLDYRIRSMTYEQYEQYMIEVQERIKKNHQKKVDRLVDTLRTNVIPKKRKRDIGTIFMRVSFRDADYPTSRKDAFRKLEYCKKRAEEWLGYKLHATYVLEKATDPKYTQRWHFHVIIYNAPYATFEEWQDNAFIYGTVNVQSVYDVTGLGKYCTKISRYIQKEQDILPKYARSYNSTIGLKKPVDLYDRADIIKVLHRIYLELGIIVQDTQWYDNRFYEKDKIKYQLWQSST